MEQNPQVRDAPGSSPIGLQMRKILLLVNPLFEERRSRGLNLIVEAFRRAGVQVEMEETGAFRAAGEKAKRAAAAGLDAVVVCGGDGTVFDVIQGLAGSNLPLGIVPFGTGNVLAQNLAIPKEPEAVVRWLLSSRRLSVPLGRISCYTHPGAQETEQRRSWYFVMSAGMGVHAALMAGTRSSAKQARGRAAYYLAGARLLLNHPPQPFDAEITTADHGVVRRRVCEAIALRVPNLNVWRPGGGLTSPFLRLVTVEGHSRGCLLRASLGIFLEAARRRTQQPNGDRQVRYEDVLRVVCRPGTGLECPVPLRVEADGELLGFPSVEIEMAGVSVNLLAHAS